MFSYFRRNIISRGLPILRSQPPPRTLALPSIRATRTYAQVPPFGGQRPPQGRGPPGGGQPLGRAPGEGFQQGPGQPPQQQPLSLELPDSGAPGQEKKSLIFQVTEINFPVAMKRPQPFVFVMGIPEDPVTKSLLATLEAKSAQEGNIFEIGFINARNAPTLLQQFRLAPEALPFLCAVVGGRMHPGSAGGHPTEQQLEQILLPIYDVVDSMSADRRISKANEALANNDVDQAARLFQEVIQQFGELVRGQSGLIRCLVRTGQLAEAQELLDRLKAAPEATGVTDVNQAAATLEIAHRFAEMDQEAAKANFQKDPKNADNIFQQALVKLGQLDYDGAVDLLFTLMLIKAPNKNDAKALLKIAFDAVGNDPKVVPWRRKLANLLF